MTGDADVGTLQKNTGAKRRSRVALLLVELINDMEFPEGSCEFKDYLSWSARKAR